MVCLDTSVLVSIIRKDKNAIEKLRIESDRDANISTTIINLCELYGGAYRSKNPEKELEKVEAAISSLRILELTMGASLRYGNLLNSLSLRRNPIGDFDLLIASIVMEFGEPLATRNTEHFGRVPGLKLEIW
jgi:tRNA(fMet)-specific endonuclease VapC